MALTIYEINTIKIAQEAYFKIGKYEQILESEGKGFWVDEYVGPQGEGYIIGEKKTELGKTYIYSLHFGPEKYRDQNNGEWI